MNEYIKLNAYYVESNDGRHVLQMARNKDDARVNAALTFGQQARIAIVRRATNDDINQARQQN